jgi:molybdopterin synthase sulfur carrier subunit
VRSETMKVRLFATLRSYAGRKEVDIPVAGGDTVRQVLEELAALCPALGERMLDEEGNIKSSVNVLVNGRSVKFLGGLNCPVRDSDRFALFPSVGGG